MSTDVCFCWSVWSESDASSLPLLLSVHFTILYVLVVLLVALFFSFLFFSLLILSHDRLSLVYNTARVEIRKGKKK